MTDVCDFAFLRGDVTVAVGSTAPDGYREFAFEAAAVREDRPGVLMLMVRGLTLAEHETPKVSMNGKAIGEIFRSGTGPAWNTQIIGIEPHVLRSGRNLLRISIATARPGSTTDQLIDSFSVRDIVCIYPKVAA